ncbi:MULTISPECIES: hypothetical protein [Cyanophyceae]|uniref:hypothetical protein n=1 Tax=Cyanophyceae TaxID=3028117 RepID=UPI001682DFEF|nr:hypothetical protein [Trichocoleus sp. FACHB-69]MBD1930696.1 hypothetical protein [Trichocoleus sp. FACHB-69]
MSKRWLSPSIALLVLLSLLGESSYAYTQQIVTSPTPLSSEVARIPVRIFQRVRNRILGTGWLGRMNRSRVKEWVNGGERGLGSPA